MPAVKLRSRAVLRPIVPGESAKCEYCDEPVKFAARKKMQRVIANVYGRDGNPKMWDRVEHFHLTCYLAAGEPYGPALS